MKKFYIEQILVFLVGFLIGIWVAWPMLAHAAEPDCVAYIPRGCEVIGSEYSSGGGDKVITYLEVDCRFPDGSYAKYIDEYSSISGLFGFGRWTMPEKILFKEWSKDALDLDC